MSEDVDCGHCGQKIFKGGKNYVWLHRMTFWRECYAGAKTVAEPVEKDGE